MSPPGQTAYRFRHPLLLLTLAADIAAFACLFAEGFNSSSFWIVFFFCVAFLQLLFLAPTSNWPVDLAKPHPLLRRSAIAAGFIGLLLTLSSCCILTEFVDFLLGREHDLSLQEPNPPDTAINIPPICVLFLLPLVWGLWVAFFYYWFSRRERYDALCRITRFILISTLILLAASLAAQAYLFRGFSDRGSWYTLIIACMLILWTSGPTLALAFIYDKVRLARLDAPHLCPNCHYNLTGTRAAHGTHCPECGQSIPPSSPSPDHQSPQP